MLDKTTCHPADWLYREPPFAIDDFCFRILQTKVVKVVTVSAKQSSGPLPLIFCMYNSDNILLQ